MTFFLGKGPAPQQHPTLQPRYLLTNLEYATAPVLW